MLVQVEVEIEGGAQVEVAAVVVAAPKEEVLERVAVREVVMMPEAIVGTVEPLLRM